MMHHNTKYYLCVSCARVIRGSGQSMEKIRDPITFSCDIQSGLSSNSFLHGLVGIKKVISGLIWGPYVPITNQIEAPNAISGAF